MFVEFTVLFVYIAGKFEEAIGHLTDAIMLNPTSAIMYGTRGGCKVFFFLSHVIL